MSEIIIPANGWKPRKHQLKLWTSLEEGKRRAIEIAHRRWGKDEIALHWSCSEAMLRVGGYWHCLPEFAQARKAIWTAVNPHSGKRRIDEAFPQEIRANTNEQEMFIRFKNGSTWQVIGSDNYDRLVGASVAGVVFSEWALANPSAWAYIAPIVAENNGWALFITTPRGKNHAKSMYDMARKDPEAWHAEVSTVDDSSAIKPEIVEAQRREYHSIYGQEAGDALIEQEFYCSFDAAILGSYYGKEMAKALKEGRIGNYPVLPGYPVHTAWDLGIRDTMVIWFFQIVPGDKGYGKVRITGCYSATGFGIGHYAEIIKKKAKDNNYERGSDWLPHDARQREMGSWGDDGKAKQRIEVMKECGLKPRLVADHKVEDGISATRQILWRCHFDEAGCGEQPLEGLRQYQTEWDDEKKIFSDRPLHNWASHYADGFRTLAMAHKEIVPEIPKSADKFLSVNAGGGVNQVTLNDLWKLQPRKPRRI